MYSFGGLVINFEVNAAISLLAFFKPSLVKPVDLSISTLRYYDKEGLFQELNKEPSGIRRFDEQSLEALRVIECLKKSGMQIKEIREFMDWCAQGDSTLERRKEMFYAQRENILKKMNELQKSLDLLDYKINVYENALLKKEKEMVDDMEIAVERRI